MSRCPVGEIAGGLGCYFCAGPRDEEIPLCAHHWQMAGESHRTTLAALYIPGQHATGQCQRGWMAAINAVCLRLDALEPPEPEPGPEAGDLIIMTTPERPDHVFTIASPREIETMAEFVLTSPEPKSRHNCHAAGCSTAVPPELLMCKRHWRMVPIEEQREVWKHYRPGQCDDRRPSMQWFLAADRACLSVARKEKRTEAVKRLEATVANKVRKLAEQAAEGKQS